MWRRTVLTTLGAGVMSLAGCSERDGPGTDPGGTEPPQTDSPASGDDRTTTDTPPEKSMESGIPRTVTPKGRSDEALRDTFDVAADVTVLEPNVTTAHTARIRVSLENTAAQPRTLTYTRETCDLNLIAGRYRRDEGVSLLLVSTEQAWERTESDCWMPDGRNLNCGIPARDHEITIAPDEPLRWTFRLWADPENYRQDACMPLGTYRFERRFRREDTEAALSFALSVDSEQ